MKDLPQLYSGSYGLGSRDLQPEAIVGAFENMLPGGEQRRQYYLSIDFLKEKVSSPKQQVHQEEILRHYPEIQNLAVHGSENPNLMPAESITVRFHSIGGWGAMATGKNLTMTLADILGYYVKANPKYGSEKKGQPTTYYLSVAPEPIKVNCEFHFVDVVLAPDPNVFKHSNPLSGLKKGGIFILQSEFQTDTEVWSAIPKFFQKHIVDNQIRFYYLDAFKIAREEARDAELQHRMQGMAFQGAFFHAAELFSVFEKRNLTEAQLFKIIEQKLTEKFGSKGQRVVTDNQRVVVRGYQECRELKDRSQIEESTGLVAAAAGAQLPIMLKSDPQSSSRLSDIHLFWEQTGSFYKTGQSNDQIANAFLAGSSIPASTGVFKDMTDIRFSVPEWIGQNCTGCGNCWSACPDSAIPGLVHDFNDVSQAAVRRMKAAGQSTGLLPGALRTVEKTLYQLCQENGENSQVAAHLEAAIVKTVAAQDEESRAALNAEMENFRTAINGFQFALTRPFFTNKDKEQPGKGGLLSVTINPYTCKGCMGCVAVCNDNALVAVPQTEPLVKQLKENWDFWLALPETQDRYLRIDDLEEGIGALETLLMKKANYMSMTGGDGACLGCAEKTILHLFTGTVTALMQGRVQKHLEKINGLVQALEERIRDLILVDIKNTDRLTQVVDSFQNDEFTTAELSARLNAEGAPIDGELLRQLAELVRQLKDLHWKYTEGVTGKGRAKMGIANSTGCSSVWGSTFPINPYPFPWVNHLFQDAPSMAMGLFEGQMRRMAEGFKAIRQAEVLSQNPGSQLPDLTYFSWKDFSEEEYLLCPPMTVVGGDGAMYDIGFQNLSRMMMSGMPIKVLVLDTQVYSNTGGQACTSGFTGQISDMAQYGKAHQGKEEVRKEIGLIGMGHRTTYVMQASQANIAHLLEGFIEGLRVRRPALFNVYCNCPPEHGTADDVATTQAKLAVESRAYPIFKYNPAQGQNPSECFNLDGNPAIDQDWPTYTLNYVNDAGAKDSMELPVTFADFAMTEARFAKQFRTIPRDAWNDNHVPLNEFLDLTADEREGLFPYIWIVDKKQRLGRVLVSESIVLSCEDRRSFWRLLKNVSGQDRAVFDEGELVDRVQSDMVDRFAESLLRLAAGR